MGTNNRDLDVNGDGQVNRLDHGIWVRDLRRIWLGDADLDGVFGTTDLLQVFQAGEYEDEAARNSTWSEGDWNADFEFNSGDLVSSFQDGGFEAGPRPPDRRGSRNSFIVRFHSRYAGGNDSFPETSRSKVFRLIIVDARVTIIATKGPR